MMHEGEARNVDLMLFPELGLCAYAIDDLLLQDALLEAVEADSRDSSRSRKRCGRCSSSARRCAATAVCTTAVSSIIARAGSSASCRSRSCRTTASTTRIAGSRPARA